MRSESDEWEPPAEIPSEEGDLASALGDPGGSRTPNPQIRSLMLYPVELRGRVSPERNQREDYSELGSETGIESDPNLDTITYNAADSAIYPSFRY